MGQPFLGPELHMASGLFFRNLHAVRPSTTRGRAARGTHMPVREPIENICCWMVPDRDRFALRAMHHLAVKMVTPTGIEPVFQP
jgi:hypothetical protein